MNDMEVHRFSFKIIGYISEEKKRRLGEVLETFCTINNLRWDGLSDHPKERW